MRTYPMVTVDVFAEHPLEGNPLAVFTDARGLSDADMQAIAREMRLSETTFIIPRDAEIERSTGVRVRIFTVEEELPFAGHPTLGTAAVLAKSRNLRDVTLELGVGPIPVHFESRPNGLFGEMTQRDPEIGSVHDRAKVAQAAGIPIEHIDANLPIQTISTGFPFAIVPLRSLDAIRSINFDLTRADVYLRGADAKQFYFVTRETENADARIHARMLFYGGEDPATGSAAGCAAAWMILNGVAKPGEQVLIEQGIEAKRPSRIFVRADLEGSQPRRVRVGGYTVEVVRGELKLP